MITTGHNTWIGGVRRRVFVTGRLSDEVVRRGYSSRARDGFVAEALVEGPVRRLTATGAVARRFAASTLVRREGLCSWLAATGAEDRDGGLAFWGDRRGQPFGKPGGHFGRWSPCLIG